MKQLIQVHMSGGGLHYLNPDRILDVYDTPDLPTIIRMAAGAEPFSFEVTETSDQVNDLISQAVG